MSEGASAWSPPALSVVTSQSAQAAYQASLDAGHRAGYQQGLQEGLAEGRRQAQSLLAEMAALWDAMQSPFLDLEAEVQAQLVGLSVAVAQGVLQRELATDTDMIRATLDDALAVLAQSNAPLRVVLNPDDKALVESLLDEQQLPADLIANPNVMRGGCQLRRGGALVDATMEARIVSAIEGLAKTQQGELANDPAASERERPLDPDRVAAIAARFSGEVADPNAE